MTFLLRTLLVLAGLVVAASFLVLFVLLLAFWGLRAAWARLTGRPAQPFVVRFGPRRGFEEFVRRAQPAASRTPRADAAGGPVRGRLADVTDIEPRA